MPRDIATREIFDICVNEGLSIDSEKMSVYLDLTHIPKAELDRKLGGILEIYEKFQGVDPRVEPMRIFPAVHYSMGGLWADYVKSASGGMEAGAPRNHMTNINGLYAIGECDYHYHGANRLGANSLLSCIFTGLFTGTSILNHAASQKESYKDLSPAILDAAVKKEQDRHDDLLKGDPDCDENPYLIHQELGDIMTARRHRRATQRSIGRCAREGRRSAQTRDESQVVGYRVVVKPERNLYQGASRHVPARQGTFERCVDERRVPGRPLQT